MTEAPVQGPPRAPRREGFRGGAAFRPEAVHAAFERPERDPFRSRPHCGIRLLKGHPGVRALRLGQYRGVYEVAGRDVRFTTFGHRRSVYAG